MQQFWKPASGLGAEAGAEDDGTRSQLSGKEGSGLTGSCLAEALSAAHFSPEKIPKMRQEGERKRKQEKEKLLLQGTVASDCYQTSRKHETTKKGNVEIIKDVIVHTQLLN